MVHNMTASDCLPGSGICQSLAQDVGEQYEKKVCYGLSDRPGL